MNNHFLKNLQNFIFQEKLLNQEDKVLVGISGGADSVGLALSFKKLQSKYKLELHLVHINYHLRGKDSEKDEKFVRKFAEENELDLTVFDYKGKVKNNLEERLRDFRYKKFEELRSKLNFNKVAVAHTKDDQAETVLMNFLRGAGISGLSGMKIKNNFLIRPLLNFSKQEIVDFLKKEKQKFRTDKTNFETNFKRNSIRLELIPFLEKKYNRKIKDNLAKLSENLRGQKDLNQLFIYRIYKKVAKIKKKEILLDLEKFKKLPLGVQKEIFRKTFCELRGNLKNVSSNHFLEFKKIFESQKSKKQRAFIGKIALKKTEKYVIFSNVKK